MDGESDGVGGHHGLVSGNFPDGHGVDWILLESTVPDDVRHYKLKQSISSEDDGIPEIISAHGKKGWLAIFDLRVAVKSNGLV